MGYSLDSFDKPVYDDVFNLPDDLTAAVEFTNTFASTRTGTSAARLALAPGKIRPGMKWQETDTGITYVHDGTGWRVMFMPFTTWNSTPTGLTLGNGTLSTKYMRRGSLVEFIIELLAGSTTGASGNVTFALPVAQANVGVWKHTGLGLFKLGSGSSWPVQPRITGAATMAVNFMAVSGSSIIPGNNLSNTHPTSGAWGAGASLFLHGIYEGVA